MARKVFYSFHYVPDNWRAAMVRQASYFEGSQTVSDNDWEKVKRGGDKAIQNWIDGQLYGRSCTIVLIGSGTAGRKWINYEIKKSWNDRKGLVGIYIHRLKDQEQNQSVKGSNPFAEFTVGNKSLSTIVNAYDPPYLNSADAYRYIAKNLEGWVEEAIEIRKNH